MTPQMTSPLSEYFVEVVDRGGTVRQRINVGHQPLVIGRGYDSDVIVDDAYLCPHHVRVWLDENNRLQVQDLASVNGLSTKRHGERVAELRLETGQNCYIGWTALRFRSTSSPVPPARVDRSHQFVFNVLQRPLWQALFALVLCLQLVYLSWLEMASDIEWHTLLVAPATIFAALASWALVWAVVGRILVHRAMFFTHLTIGVVLACISLLVESGISYGLFIFDADFLSSHLFRVTSFIISAATFYAHLHFATRIRPKAQLVSALVISSIISLVSFYVEYSYQDVFTSSPVYEGSLKPPAYIVFEPITSETFFVSMEDLKRQVDAARAEDAGE
jgi:hypothetical protein